MDDAIDWGDAKNSDLKRRYGFGFERILVALSEDGLLGIRAHPDQERYAHQRQLLVRIDGYVWVVPFVETEGKIFLKTMYPSRKAMRDMTTRDGKGSSA